MRRRRVSLLDCLPRQWVRDAAPSARALAARVVLDRAAARTLTPDDAARLFDAVADRARAILDLCHVSNAFPTGNSAVLRPTRDGGRLEVEARGSAEGLLL